MTASAAPRQKTILLVDDEIDLSKALAAHLEKAGYKCFHAPETRTAKNLFLAKSFDLVISDIHMPASPTNGIELLHFVRRQKKDLPFILVTGFTELAEAKEASSLGATAFLTKPFSAEDLITEIKRVLNENEILGSLTPEAIDSEFAKLTLADFVSGTQVRFSIYVKLKPGKYVKIAHQGEDLDNNRITVLRDKGIQHLYLTRVDFRKYLGFNVFLTKQVGAQSQVDPAKKLALIKHTGEILLEQIRGDDLDPADFDFAKALVETTVSVVTDTKMTFELLSVLKNHKDWLYSHSVAVCFFASLIARQAKWATPTTLSRLAIAALFHDLGKKELDPAMISKPRHELTHEEVRLLESHPQRTVELLSRVPDMAPEVLQAVAQHHETCNGRGYPSGVRRDKIYPMARIIAVADEFCKLSLPSPGFNGLPTQEALQQLLMLQKDALDPDFLSGLISLFRTPGVPGSVGKKPS